MDIFTPLSIQFYTSSFNAIALITTLFALFCVFSILRHSSKGLELGYRFHLLNITVWTLFCDLALCGLNQTYVLLPMHAACYIGKLNTLLLGPMRPDSLALLNFVGFWCSSFFDWEYESRRYSTFFFWPTLEPWRMLHSTNICLLPSWLDRSRIGFAKSTSISLCFSFKLCGLWWPFRLRWKSTWSQWESLKKVDR